MTGKNVPLQDAEGFSRFYEQSHLSVFRFIFLLHGGSQPEIEDLTAETYFRAWKGRAGFQGDQDAALGWLLKIARNLVIDTYRRKKVRYQEINMEVVDETVTPTFPDASPEDLVVNQDQRKALRELLQALKPEQREMLLLRYLMDWPVKRIATHLDMAENNVSVYLRRILDHLRRELIESI